MMQRARYFLQLAVSSYGLMLPMRVVSISAEDFIEDKGL